MTVPLPVIPEPWLLIAQKFDGGVCRFCFGRVDQGEIVAYNPNASRIAHPACLVAVIESYEQEQVDVSTLEPELPLIVRVPTDRGAVVEDDVLRPEDVARLLHVSTHTFNSRLREGVYAGFPRTVDRLARTRRTWNRAEVEAWLKEWNAS